MAMIPAKCTNCGANIQVDESKEAGICEACGTAFITEKVINNYNTTNNYHIETVNVFASEKDFQIVSGRLVKYKGESSTVVVPNNVKTIAADAFEDCDMIESIYLPQSVKRIEYGWLSGDVEDILIKVDSLEHWCSIDLTRYIDTYGITLEVNGDVITDRLIIPNGVKTIHCGIFSYFENITEVVIPPSVERIENVAFSHCKNLKHLVIPNSVVSIGDNAFECCYELESITFSNNLKSIGKYAFAYCKKLKAVMLPDSVNSMDSACFAHCDALESIKFSASLTEIPYHTCSECSNLREVLIPASVGKVKAFSFEKCYALTTFTFDKTTTKVDEEAFKGTSFSCQGGCYIATCVYGSYDCPQVWTLRRYRDDTLGSTWYGRLFIRVYYAISPTLVKRFGKTAWFKRMWQGKLDKMVKKLNGNGVENTPYQDKEW